MGRVVKMKLQFLLVCLTVFASILSVCSAYATISPPISSMNFAKQPPGAETAFLKRLADKNIKSSFVSVQNKVSAQKKKLKTPVIVGMAAVGVGILGAGAVYLTQQKKEKKKSSKSSSSAAASDNASSKSANKVVEVREGWSKIINKDRYFYYNKAENKSQWDPPDCFPEDQAAAAAAAAANRKSSSRR
eukprot:GDKJ01023762.1.p1 GENE.GDKJ01023762.1~~GDKJ01023762.1.p1  ORF type:complete len:189 (-),score=54.10 GDKJ01023762.1:292-858(-)